MGIARSMVGAGGVLVAAAVAACGADAVPEPPPSAVPLQCPQPGLDPGFSAGHWDAVYGEYSLHLAVADTGEVLTCGRYALSQGGRLGRLLGDGSYDTGFGTSGSVLLDYSTRCAGLVMIEGVRAVMAANVSGGRELLFVEPDGTLTDPGVGLPRPAGATSVYAGPMARAGDGSLVVAGLVDGAAAVWRLDATLQPITGFGGGGVVVPGGALRGFQVVPSSGPPAAIVVAHGQQVTTLDATTGAVVSTTVAVSATGVLGLAVTGAGTYLLTDDGGGLVVAPVDGGPATQLDLFAPAGMVIDGQGRLVVVGSASIKTFGVARLDPARFDGVHPWSRFDPTMGEGGVTYFPYPYAVPNGGLLTAGRSITALMSDTDRLLIGAEMGGTSQYGDLYVTRMVLP